MTTTAVSAEVGRNNGAPAGDQVHAIAGLPADMAILKLADEKIAALRAGRKRGQK